MLKFLARLFGRQPKFSEATSRDAAAIAVLHAQSFHRGWSEQEVEALLLDRFVIAHRALAGTKPIAFIISRIAADEAEILSIAVARAAQGRRVARGLLMLHLRRLAGIGVVAVFLEVDKHNTPALRLYRRAGFREVGRRPNYYANPAGESAAALLLRRDL